MTYDQTRTLGELGQVMTAPSGLAQIVTSPSPLDNSLNVAPTSFVNAVGPVVGTVRGLKMYLTAASATGTMTANEIIVETALGGAPLRLSNFSQSINLATTGAGGMDTGTAPVSGYVGIYAIYNPTTLASALLATNASAALPQVYSAGHMPSGYTASALVSVWGTTSGSLLIGAGQLDRTIYIPGTIVYNASGTASSVATSLAAAVPLNGISWSGSWTGSSTAADAGVLGGITGSPGGYGGASVGFVTVAAANSETYPVSNIPILVAQTTYVSVNTNSGTAGLEVLVNSYSF